MSPDASGAAGTSATGAAGTGVAGFGAAGSGSAGTGSSASGTGGTTGAAGVNGSGPDGGAGTSPDGGSNAGTGGGVDPAIDLARRTAIIQTIQAAGKLPAAAVDPKHVVDCMNACPSTNSDGWACQGARYVEARAFDRFSVFQSTSAQLWPGNVVNGTRALKGELVPLAVSLAPQTFSVSLENIAGSPTGMMEHPSLSSFRSERNRILAASVTGATTALISYQIEEISTDTQLNFALGASFPLKGIIDISSGFDFSSGSKTSKVLLDFTQIYYSFDLDSPKSPADFFTTDTTAATLMTTFASNEPPMYVQSVLFGRRILLAFQSTDTRQSLHAAVKAAVESLKVGASVEAGTTKTISRSTIKSVIIGGAGDAAAAAVTNGVDGIKALINQGGNYSMTNPGAPIGYNLAYLDNTPVKTVVATDYVDTTCTRTAVTVHASLDSIVDLTPDIDGNSDFYGFVDVFVPSATYNGACPTAAGTFPGFGLMDYDEGQHYHPTDTYAGMATSVPIDAAKFICIRARLIEDDIAFDDDYGGLQVQIPWGEWEGPHKLQLRNMNNAADVTVTITLP